MLHKQDEDEEDARFRLEESQMRRHEEGSHVHFVAATDTITHSESYDIKSWGLAGSKALSATETEEIRLLVIAQQAGTGA